MLEQANNLKSRYRPRITLLWGIVIAFIASFIAGFVAVGDPVTARVLAMSVLGIAIFLAIKLPKFGWGKIALIFWFAFSLASMGWSTRTGTEERQYLKQLKITDAVAYEEYIGANTGNSKTLIAVKDVDADRYEAIIQLQKQQALEVQQLNNDQILADMLEQSPHQWLRKLEEIDPEKYAAVMVGRDARLAELEEDVRAVPAGDLEEHRSLYRELVALAPQNFRYLEKLEFYETQLKKREWESKHCTSSRYNLISARVYAEDLVKERLVAPRTARFSPSVEEHYIGDCRFIVESHVDSQNGFGAMIRTRYKATLVRTENAWLLEDLRTQ